VRALSTHLKDRAANLIGAIVGFITEVATWLERRMDTSLKTRQVRIGL
jgi:hypothetical protein